MQYSFLMAAFAALAVAAPSISKSSKVTYSTKNYNASFDDITVLPGVVLQPIGVYDGLSYTNFELDNEALGLVGVAPHSLPNSAVYQGLSGTASLSAIYTKSSVSAFKLKQFYFGCTLNDSNGVASAAETCTIQVTGYKGSYWPQQSKSVSTQFTFTAPLGGVLDQMVLATLPSSFNGLQNVTISIVSATSTALLTGVLTDNFVYEVQTASVCQWHC